MGYEARTTHRGTRRRATAGLALLAACFPLLGAGTAHAAAGGAGAGFSLAAVAFWAFAALTLGSAAGVAFSRSIVYSAFSLLGTFLGVAGLYVFLAADFLAVVQLLIYVGGVLVLFLFAVMLTRHIEVKVSNVSMHVVLAGAAALTTAGILGFAAVHAPWKAAAAGVATRSGPTAEALGELFLGEYLLPFEIVSVVLLVTLIGAVVVARKELRPE